MGLDLGTFLVQAGKKDEGLEILKRSHDGFNKLGMDEYVSYIREIIDQVEENK